jgi:hypothetical protein
MAELDQLGGYRWLSSGVQNKLCVRDGSLRDAQHAVGSVVEILGEYDDQAKFGVDAWLLKPTSDSRVH